MHNKKKKNTKRHSATICVFKIGQVGLLSQSCQLLSLSMRILGIKWEKSRGRDGFRVSHRRCSFQLSFTCILFYFLPAPLIRLWYAVFCRPGPSVVANVVGYADGHDAPEEELYYNIWRAQMKSTVAIVKMYCCRCHYQSARPDPCGTISVFRSARLLGRRWQER